MKRAPFIGATAAVLLAGCGGNHVLRALPGVASSSSSGQPHPLTGNARLVPDVADTIPTNVLASPMIGEFRRFGGQTAPSGWMFAQGQAFSATDNPRLFSLLGNLTGDGRTTFRLPNPGYAAIIAVAGSFPTAPAMLAASGRHMTPKDSLGPNAVARPLALKTVPPKRASDLAAQRKLIASEARVSRGGAVPVPRELAARYGQAQTDARSAALAVLGSSSRARLDAALDAVASGRTSVYGAVTEMISSLTNDEAYALLHVDDAMIQPFNDRAVATRSSDPRTDAAHFLVSVAFSPEQLRALYRLERSRV
jgi:Phage Tail Collar Domain